MAKVGQFGSRGTGPTPLASLTPKPGSLTPFFPTPSGDTQSTITYDLALDPGRPHSLAIFDETQNSTRRRVETLRLSQKCETLKLRLLVSRG